MPTISRFAVATFILIIALPLLAEEKPSVERAPAPKEIIEKKPPLPDLSEFRTVETAIQTKLGKAVPKSAAQPGYLGVQLESAEKGRFVIGLVEPDSPAAAVKLQKGDIIEKIDGHTPVDSIQFRELVQAKSPGEPAKITIQRAGKPLEITATLAATSRPMPLMNSRTDLGIRTSEEEDGLRVDRVFPSSPAQAAGVKSGDLIIKIDQTLMHAGLRISDVIAEKAAGDNVTVRIRRDGKEIDLSVKVPKVEMDTSRMSWDARSLSIFKKDVYHLAVLIIEYPDGEHNPKITPKDWETALFSRKTYNDKSVTGQKVYGSLNDYYHEISCGRFRVEGKVFEPVKVSKKRAEYTNDTNRLALLTETIDKLLARDGKEALKEFDGLCFIYSGNRVQTNRGGLYWPHRASVNHNGKRWPYYICPEGGGTMTNISVYCHEFGHMLGLPDLYARPENPGSEGVGVWCAMSNQSGGGRPQHFSAWSKEQLGWLQPAIIDPTVKQKLILSPVETSPKECFKVLVRSDGSEYLLLENRQRKGYDASLPGDGLLIWRILDGKPFLEESHGISGPSGPRSYLSMVPFPSKANNAFTPYTTPSSKSRKGGGLPVSITNIQRLSDGRITFFIGYESY
ncbi:MAG TPA: M6 family metalloprotease domain-containing protein [Gemmataceae bacterium]|nr:M6 family metalloprotease domain-containing protein [Gemmataceae bacterium]